VRRYRPIELPGAGLKRRAFTSLAAFLSRIGLFGRITPAFYLLGTVQGQGEAPFSLAERALRLAGDDLQEAPTLALSTTHSVHLRGRSRFVKLPISDEAARRLEQAWAGWRAIRDGAGSASWLLDEARLDRLGRLPIYSEPLCRPLVPDERDEALACIRCFLEFSQTGAKSGRLDLNRRFEGVKSFSLALGHSPSAIDALIERLQGQGWPLSACHGDLHLQNVVRAPDGRTALIDWDRYEAAGPWQLDVLHVCIRTLMSDLGLTWSRALTRLRDGLVRDEEWPLDLKGWEIDRRAESFAALLDLYVLDRIEKDLNSVPHPVYIGDPWRAQVEGLLEALLAAPNLNPAAPEAN
jgi:hypothetical protein